MKTVVLKPIADVIVPWTPVPNDGLGHFAKVDEGVAGHDGTATYLTDATGADESLRFESVPLDIATFIAFRCYIACRCNIFGAGESFVFKVGGVDYVDEFFVDFTVLPLNEWVTVAFTVQSVPTLLPGSTIEVTMRSSLGGARFDVTALQLEVDYVERPRIVYTPVTPISTPWTPVPDPPEFS